MFEYNGHTFALISKEEYDFFDGLEDKYLNERANEAMKEPGETITLDELRAKLGI